VIVQQLSDLVHAQITTMQATNKIEPASFIHPRGLDHERVIIRPFQTDGRSGSDMTPT
jgi:hypothetical protein